MYCAVNMIRSVSFCQGIYIGYDSFSRWPQFCRQQEAGNRRQGNRPRMCTMHYYVTCRLRNDQILSSNHSFSHQGIASTIVYLVIVKLRKKWVNNNLYWNEWIEGDIPVLLFLGALDRARVCSELHTLRGVVSHVTREHIKVGGQRNRIGFATFKLFSLS